MSNGSMAFSGALAWVLPVSEFAKDTTAAACSAPLHRTAAAGGIPV